MRPVVHWIETPAAGRLAIMARPRAGDWLDDEVSGWRMEGIDIVVSLLEPEEVSELGLQREAHLCEVHVMEFISFPIPDRGVPGSLGEAAALARLLALRISEGKAVLSIVELGSDVRHLSPRVRSPAWEPARTPRSN
jgi:hypothetical protein